MLWRIITRTENSPEGMSRAFYDGPAPHLSVICTLEALVMNFIIVSKIEASLSSQYEPNLKMI